MSNDNIVFAGIGRVHDQLPLASVFDRMASAEKNEIESAFHKFLADATSRLSPGSRDKRPIPDGVMYLLADKEVVCVYAVAVRNKTYPERLVFAFLGEFMALVTTGMEPQGLATVARPNALTKSLSRPVKELMTKYDKPANVDKTALAQGKVEHVKGIMQENIGKVLATHANIEDLEAKTDNLSTNAAAFSQDATRLRKAMWWKNVKVMILLGVVVLIILAYIIVMLVKFLR